MMLMLQSQIIAHQPHYSLFQLAAALQHSFLALISLQLMVSENRNEPGIFFTRHVCSTIGLPHSLLANWQDALSTYISGSSRKEVPERSLVYFWLPLNHPIPLNYHWHIVEFI